MCACHFRDCADTCKCRCHVVTEPTVSDRDPLPITARHYDPAAA